MNTACRVRSCRHPERSEGPLFVFCRRSLFTSGTLRLSLLLLSVALVASAKTKSAKSQSADSLDAYLATARKSAPADVPTMGSLWNPNGRMSDLATDTKARFVGDLVTINIIESTNSAQQESAQTSRAFSASSSLAALLGTTNARAQNLFSPSSTQSLNGKGQTALATSLTTTLAASVTEVLPNGNLVIEARRDVLVTNQKETMTLRGIIRREDLSPANVVASTAISHLEVSLKGNGVISESTHAPNIVVRILLRIFNF
jgi:flagellar L-ring protein FlgH